jgi:RNA polymerase sigma-70 factor, ECF subfamily
MGRREGTRPSPGDVTKLLVAWGGGDHASLDRLMPIVYDELRLLAHHRMRGERPGHTLQTTALVNEAYLRLVDLRQIQWQDRVHFFAMCARLMRRVLVEVARSRRYLKRGGGRPQITFHEALMVSNERGTDLVALDDALETLAAVDHRKSQVVELRFFGGLTVEETAEALRVSRDTVIRDWNIAKVWLLRELDQERHDA